MHASVGRNPQWAPQGRYGRPEDINVADAPEYDFELAIDKLIYGCRFQRMPDADRLFVSLRSSRGMPLELPPVFYPQHSAAEMNGHVLAISDPTLFLDPEIEIGCFYGTRQQDAVLGVIQIAEKIAAFLGLDRSRIVYWGLSAAALGAAMAAVKSGACAVLVNPHLDGINMGGSHLADSIAKAFGVSKWEDVTNGYPLRTRVPAALAAAQALGIQSKFLLVQNVLDQTFYKRQFVPFCRHFEVPLEGGWDPSGRIMSMIYSDPAGHSFGRPEDLKVLGVDGRPRPAVAADYTDIRWQLKNSLKANSVAFVRFRALVK